MLYFLCRHKFESKSYIARLDKNKIPTVTLKQCKFIIIIGAFFQGKLSSNCIGVAVGQNFYYCRSIFILQGIHDLILL